MEVWYLTCQAIVVPFANGRMCRMLGLGQIIHKADNLPSYEAGQEIPKDLGEKYGRYIEGASNSFLNKQIKRTNE